MELILSTKNFELSRRRAWLLYSTFARAIKIVVFLTILSSIRRVDRFGRAVVREAI